MSTEVAAEVATEVAVEIVGRTKLNLNYSSSDL